jgi:hypothetical protein
MGAWEDAAVAEAAAAMEEAEPVDGAGTDAGT